MNPSKPPAVNYVRFGQRPAAAMPSVPQTPKISASAEQIDLFGTPVASPAPTAPVVKKKGGMNISKVSASSVDSDDRPNFASVGPTLAEIVGKVERVIYTTSDGYAVYALKDSTGNSVKVAVTSPIAARQGDKVMVKGSWGTYQGQPNFKAVMLMLVIAKGARGVLTWGKTGAVPGVGKATFEKLAKFHGDNLPDLMPYPEELAKADIPRDKAELISDAWNSNAGQPELLEFLGRFGLGEMTIAKIVKRYGGAARRIIRENPWALAETIDGVGFATADEIAIEAGHAKDSEVRLKAGIRFALEQKTGREGHCALPLDILIDEAVKLLSVNRNLVAAAANSVIEDKSVKADELTGLVYPINLYKSENDLAERLTRLMRDGDRVPDKLARRVVEQAVAEIGVTRDESQVEAAVMAVTSPLSIITGGPGTGKSTTQRVIVRAFELLEKEVGMAAPTGRAAKRLSEVAGRSASTCHRLLSFSAEKGGFEYDSSNPFPEDRIIIDEFSMVDIRLGQSFMDAVKREGGITIVGDVDQLPSVGAGQVLRDLIESGVIPVARLKTVHRQQGDSGIVVAAARINAGEHPLGADQQLNGFDFHSGELETSTPDDIRKTVVDLMSVKLPAMGYDPIQDIQVLSPMRKGDLGIYVLNEELKKALNPAKDDNQSVEVRKRVFTVGDRVMHLRNDYAKKVYNGEVGTVTWVGTRKNDDNKDEPCFKVDYSGFPAFYGPADVNDVELSWAATVHKSQGCEFPVVIFVCPDAHRRMLTRNLLYTAVTRAKKLCIVVGHDSALMHAVENADVDSRYTGLSKRMLALQPVADQENQQFLSF